MNAMWMVLMAFFSTMCAPVGVAVAEVLTHRLFPQQLHFAAQGLSLAAAAVCYMLFLRGASAGRRRGVTLWFLKALLWMAAWGIVLHRLLLISGRYDMSVLGRGVPLLLPLWTAAVVIGLLAEITLVHWSVYVWYSDGRPGFWRSTGHLLRHPVSLLLILAGGALGAVIWAETDVALMFAGMRSLTTAVAVLLLRMVLIWVIAEWVLGALTRRMGRFSPAAAAGSAEETEDKETDAYEADGHDAERYDAEGRDAEQPERRPVKTPAVSLAAAFLVFLLSGAVTFGGMLLHSNTDSITDEIDRELRDANAEFLAGKTAAAVKRYRTAGQMIRAVGAYAKTEGEGFEYDAEVSSPLTEYMRLLEGESPETLEREIRLGERGMAWYPALLTWYEGAEELTPEQQQLRTEMLLRCVAAGFYQVYPNRAWMERHELALNSRIGEYGDTETEIRLACCMNDAAAAGGASQEVVDRALDEAEKHPDHLLSQYVAFSLGSEYRVDDAKHYQRTVEAAKRYDSLFSATGPDREVLADQKAAVADAIRACYAFADALPYYEEVYELTGEASDALALAECCERAERYDLCEKYAALAAEADPENIRALYLECLCCIKTGAVDRALEAAGTYSDLLQSAEAPDYSMEQLFYVIAQYLAMTDSGQWTDYVYHYYDDFTEAQLQEAQKHEFLWWYMTAINSCFMKKDYAEAERMLDQILAVHGELPMAWYLKGVVCGSRKEFEKAEQALLQANEIRPDIPAVLYTLANVYDAMKDYEKAYEYSSRVNAILPEQDHGNDLYGIAYHNGNLLRGLEKELGK